MKIFKQGFVLFVLTFSSSVFAAAPAGTTVSAADASAARGAVSKIQESAAQTTANTQGAPAAMSTPKAPPAPAPVLYGITIPAVLVSDNPPQTHVYSAIVWYHPQKWSWRNDHVNLFVAGSFGHWWSKGGENYSAINIYALVPVVRFYPFKSPYFSPYIEASVGPAYMTNTRFGGRNLGIHYTFQDQATIGAVFSDSAGFYASFSIVHYSNGALSAHNSGITVPLILNIGYQFN